MGAITKQGGLLDYLVYVVVRVLICVAQSATVETGATVARALAWFMGDVLRLRRSVVDDNLRHAFAELSDAERRRLARRMWEHLFLLVLEVAHSPRKIHDTNWRHHVRLNNVAPLVEALLGDRPTMLVTAHFGNFEVAGFTLGLLGFPTYSVARTLDNPYLDRFVNQFRGMTGQYIIPKKGGYDQILDVLGDGQALAFLADQYAGPKGCWVEFFGRPASAHKAIALLSLENDAPMIVCAGRRLDRPMQFEMRVTGIADPREAGDEVGSLRQLTQWYTSRLEELIRLSPEQYWWVHRRWRDPRPAVKLRRKAA
jgi:Kdo2-lipid IVA lauroyltransferase/acyltransferase